MFNKYAVMSLFSWKEKAFAKVNLHLEVLNRRKDGFHNIFSLMTQVGLADEVVLEEAVFDSSGLSPCSVRIANTGGDRKDTAESIPVEDNLITRAVRAFCAEAGISGSFYFSLVKNIPAGAGLGGGSSDAAAAIRLLSRQYPMAEDRILKIGAAAGSDVPFLIKGGSAFCSGRGEILEPLNGRPDCTVVLVNNGIHVNTGQAYRMLGRTEDFSGTADRQAVRDGALSFFSGKGISSISSVFINDFEGPVFKEYSVLADIKSRLMDLGAEFAVMSGSGSTIAGLFSGEKKAEAAVKCLKSQTETVILTVPV